MNLEDETAVPDNLAAAQEDTVAELAEVAEMAETESAVAEAEPLPPEVVVGGGRVSGISLDQLTTYFAACGRCGYFLAGYWAAMGRANLQTAVDRAKSGWIVLTWNDVVRELVLKSYACDIEENDLHFESCCPECRRHFIFRASRRPNYPHTLRIEMKPRQRQ